MKLTFSFLFFALSFVSVAQTEVAATVFVTRSFTIKTQPSDAIIIQKIGAQAIQKGVGITGTPINFKNDDEVLVFDIVKEGFKTVTRQYSKSKDKKNAVAQDIVELSTRVVRINATPTDAKIYSGGIELGVSPQSVFIPKNQSVTVEVKKPGFQTLSKVFSNSEGQDIPEISHLFKLEDRLISLKTLPNDAIIYADDKKVGEGAASIVIKRDNCVTIKVEKLGYATTLTTYCNKENEVVPPMTDELRLKDRIVQINVQPDDAKILIDAKEVGRGSYTLRIPEGKCTQVVIEKTGYAQEQKQLCNKQDVEPPDASFTLKMDADEAFTQSEESSIANKNFSIEINPSIAPLEAWKKLTSIIQSYFDEIESIDGTTGYLRTNWTSSTLLNKGKALNKLIRTRVVITNAGTTPIKYNLKIQSELSKTDKGCVNEDSKTPPLSRDDCFESFPRILRKYNDLISEVQRRLQ